MTSSILAVVFSISGPYDILPVVQQGAELARLPFQLVRPASGPLAYLVKAL